MKEFCFGNDLLKIKIMDTYIFLCFLAFYSPCLSRCCTCCVCVQCLLQLLFQAVYPQWRMQKGAAIFKKEKLSNLQCSHDQEKDDHPKQQKILQMTLTSVYMGEAKDVLSLQQNKNPEFFSLHETSLFLPWSAARLCQLELCPTHEMSVNCYGTT